MLIILFLLWADTAELILSNTILVYCSWVNGSETIREWAFALKYKEGVRRRQKGWLIFQNYTCWREQHSWVYRSWHLQWKLKGRIHGGTRWPQQSHSLFHWLEIGSFCSWFLPRWCLCSPQTVINHVQNHTRGLKVGTCFPDSSRKQDRIRTDCQIEDDRVAKLIPCFCFCFFSVNMKLNQLPRIIDLKNVHVSWILESRQR